MKTELFLLVGMLAMLPIALLFNRFYKLTVAQLSLFIILLTLTGLVGGAVMYFIENGSLGGFSFYGAIFLAPVQMYFLAKCFHISPVAVVDLCAPIGCIMLAIQKANCLRTGCCAGRIIARSATGSPIRFPSQILEGSAALIICLFLYWLVSTQKHRGRILPCFLILYGFSRFGLNLMRDTVPALFGLAVGNIWSIVSIVSGVILLICINIKQSHTKTK